MSVAEYHFCKLKTDIFIKQQAHFSRTHTYPRTHIKCITVGDCGRREMVVGSGNKSKNEKLKKENEFHKLMTIVYHEVGIMSHSILFLRPD